MNNRIRQLLPSSHYSSERSFEYGHTYHGDIFLKIGEQRTERKDIFAFAHGNEATILACFAGFCVRSGMEASERQQIFTGFLSSVEDYEPRQIKRYRHEDLFLQFTASGRPQNRFNNQAMGWEALCVPIPHHPGTIEDVGGVGIYSRTDVFDVQSLVMSNIPSRLSIAFPNQEEINTSEIYIDDIPVIGRAICSLAMGEDRHSIVSLINDLGSEITE